MDQAQSHTRSEFFLHLDSRCLVVTLCRSKQYCTGNSDGSLLGKCRSFERLFFTLSVYLSYLDLEGGSSSGLGGAGLGDTSDSQSEGSSEDSDSESENDDDNEVKNALSNNR